MNPAAKLGAYGVLLAAVLGLGAAVGAAAGPIDVGHADRDAAEHSEAGEAGTLPVGGLLVSDGGYTFAPVDRLADPGPFSFTIVGPDQEPLRAYDLLHERELHLVMVSRDLRTYLHLHPERDAGGTWSVELPPVPPGSYRAFADFQPRGAGPYTLGVDLVAAGEAAAAPPLEPQVRDAVDGYEVTMDADAAEGGAEVIVTVRRDGAVVATEPYLGAAGHLVAIRDGDLAYLHVHPVDSEESGPVRFAVEVPSAGTYALFFDFQVSGVVRTARFVLEASAPATVADHGGEEH